MIVTTENIHQIEHELIEWVEDVSGQDIAEVIQLPGDWQTVKRQMVEYLWKAGAMQKEEERNQYLQEEHAPNMKDS